MRTTTPNNTRQSRVDDESLHSVAHSKSQQDEKKRGSFSWSSAPFGEVEPIIDRYRGIAELETTYNGQEVCLALWGCGNMENLEANLPFFWEVVDKYAELYQASKKAIVEYYDNDEDEYYAIKNFFYELFSYKDEKTLIEVFGVKELEQFDIKTFVDKMSCPDLTIYFNYGMDVCLFYKASPLEDFEDYVLCVTMDKNLNIKGFSAVFD